MSQQIADNNITNTLSISNRLCRIENKRKLARGENKRKLRRIENKRKLCRIENKRRNFDFVDNADILTTQPMIQTTQPMI